MTPPKPLYIRLFRAARTRIAKRVEKPYWIQFVEVCLLSDSWHCHRDPTTKKPKEE